MHVVSRNPYVRAVCHCTASQVAIPREAIADVESGECRTHHSAGWEPTGLGAQGRLKSMPSILAKPKVKNSTPSSASMKSAATLPPVLSSARLSAPLFPWS